MKRIEPKRVLLTVITLVIAPGIALAGEERGTNMSDQSDRSAPSEADWACVTREAAFSPRDTAEGLVYDGKMWLSNGYYYHGNVLTRDLWASTDGATWSLVNGETPYGGYSELVAYQGKMWAVKGSVWTSTDGVAWTQILDKTPFGERGYGEVVVYDDKLWQLGSGEDVWSSTDGVTWTCATSQAPYGGRWAAAAAVFHGKLWLMGGKTDGRNDPPEKQYPDFTTHNDVWTSDDGQHWERVLEHAPWSPRMWFAAEVYASKLWVIGGFDNANGRNLGDVWCTDDGVTWREFRTNTCFTPRHEPTCYIYDGSLWVIAGNTWPVVNDAWRLTLPEASRSEDR